MWAGSKLGIRTEMDSFLDIRIWIINWISYLAKSNESAYKLLSFMSTIWTIWISRNNYLFRGHDVSGNAIYVYENLLSKALQSLTWENSTKVKDHILAYELDVNLKKIKRRTIFNLIDHCFRKFTEDGRYLISFSRNLQELIVYRPAWLSFSCSGQNCDAHDLPLRANKFDSFFTQLYCVSLASSNELICKDFFLYMESYQFGLFATSTAQPHDAPATGGAVQGVPSIEKITFHLLRLEDGIILDKKIFFYDYINLAHNMGVYLYDDLLAIVSIRFQTIHILQIRESGHLVDSTAVSEKSKLNQTLVNSSENILSNNIAPQNVFLTGIKQRLLSFIYRGIWNEEVDETQRVQWLKKRFYFHFQDYVDLIIWKVQFLDRHHLLIKFGSVDGGVSRNTDHHPAFYAVYDMESAEFVAFYQNSADELYLLFEQFADHFHTPPNNSIHVKFISSHSNNVHASEQLAFMKNKSGSFSQASCSLILLALVLLLFEKLNIIIPIKGKGRPLHDGIPARRGSGEGSHHKGVIGASLPLPFWQEAALGT
ncbi:hypothetical protein KSS87_015218 [Heliosperma pusillum]|nr:hypothetical protein KSS87_015218 [Heliosperma pusillum]